MKYAQIPFKPKAIAPYDANFLYEIDRFVKLSEDSAHITIGITPPGWFAEQIDVETLRVDNLSVLFSDGQMRVFEFSINNTMLPSAMAINNVTWRLDTGEQNISSNNSLTLAAAQSVFTYIDYNYSASGTYPVLAEATDGVSVSSKTIDITV